MPFYLTPTFETKTFLGTIKIGFVFVVPPVGELHFSCALLTDSPRTMQLQLKRMSSFHFLLPFIKYQTPAVTITIFQSSDDSLLFQ
jgi:hypothetical protein